jgi:DNA methylase
MITTRYIVGDVFEVLAGVPAASVDLVVTSPPFLALRSYLPPHHPHKAKEIGSEATPADYLDALLDVVEACDRVLAPHGSLVFELGDTYSGSGGAGGDYNEDGLRRGQPAFDGSARRTRRIAEFRTERESGGNFHSMPPMETPLNGGAGWPADKSLCGIPDAFALSLEYGWHMLRPGRRTPQWRVRNKVVWCRPNPPVGALGDKMRPATSYLTVACKSRTRWFDMDAVRVPLADSPGNRYVRKVSKRDASVEGLTANNVITSDYDPANNAGAPLLDYWEISTRPYSGAHYATWPEEIARRAILLMCPLKVCTVCGEPSRRLVEKLQFLNGKPKPEGRQYTATKVAQRSIRGQYDYLVETEGQGTFTVQTTTLGWTHCGCGRGCRPTTWKLVLTEVEQYRLTGSRWVDADEWEGGEPDQVRTRHKRKRVVDDVGECRDPSHWRAGVVLDPFAGSGTTLAVALGNGRSSIGVDIDERNADLAVERVGPLFLEVC